MTRPTFEELMAGAGRFIGPPRPPKMQPRSVSDFTETEAQALRNHLDALQISTTSAREQDRRRDPHDQ